MSNNENDNENEYMDIEEIENNESINENKNNKKIKKKNYEKMDSMIGVDGEITQFKINENKNNNLNNNNNHNNNNNKNNNDFDKKSNITQDRYIDEEEQDDNIKLQGDNPIQENNDKVSEIFQNNTNLIPNKDSTMKFQENVENDLNQNNNKNNNQNLNQNYNNNNIQNNNNYNNFSNSNQLSFLHSTNNNLNNYDKSLHVHNPVPLSKLQQTENKYWEIKQEIENKFFINQLDTTQNNIRKNKEMITYLQKLNDVLTEFISNSKIQSIKKEKISKKNNNINYNNPEYIYQEQQRINDNAEKLLEVYKKQYSNLQNRLKQVSEDNYLNNLETENNALDKMIYNYEIENKRLKNEEKLNDIIINKQNKGENKNAIILKRMTMDFDSLNRQNEKLKKGIEQKKIKEEENEKKINNLNDFILNLRKVAKEMYNINEFDSKIKIEEKKEKNLINQKNNLQKNVEILEKSKQSNAKKYELKIKNNEKDIENLKLRKKNLQTKLENLKNEVNTYENNLKNYKNKKNVNNNYDENENNNNYEEIEQEEPLPEATQEERKKIMKEIEHHQKEKEKEEIINILNQVNTTTNNVNNNEVNHKIKIDDNSNITIQNKKIKSIFKPFKEINNNNNNNHNISITNNHQDISNINPIIENSNFGTDQKSEHKINENEIAKIDEENFLDKEEIESNGGILNNEKESNNNDENKDENEEKEEEEENNNEDNNEKDSLEHNKEDEKKEDIPQFLSDFKDENNNNNNTNENLNNNEQNNDDNLQVSNQAVKDRKSIMEVLQKESYDNLIKTNKLNKKENEVPKPPGEYEEIDEFQI